MRNLKPILVIVISAGILSWLVGWWMIGAVSFIVAIAHKLKPTQGFVCGFLGCALLWSVFALWRDIPNEHILSNRMAGLLGMPNGWMFMLLTIVLGGLTGGLSGLSGSMMNKAFRKP